MKPSRMSWVCALCLLVAAVTGARADLLYTPEETPDGAVFLVVSGVISSTEDIGAFSRAIAASHAQAVMFDSPGGNIDKALELGRLIRKLDLDTIQLRRLECASACAFAFLGGVMRYAEPGSIGVHKAWFVDERPTDVDLAVATVQQTTADVIGYIVEMGADPALMAVALSYDSNDMRYLSDSEMTKFRVNTPDEEDPVAEAAAMSPAVPVPLARPLPTSTARTGAAAAGAQAIFYQERTSEAGGTAEMGTIVWSLVQESPGFGAPPEPAIHGKAVIPGVGVRLSLSIKRNVDITIPASHTVEMIFTTPENFEGGGIDSILRIALKPSEVDAGEPLLGIPVKIADGYFIVALNEGQPDLRSNLSLLESDQWIDVPLTFKSGRRALMTLEKGAFGNFAFNGAVSAWRWNSELANPKLGQEAADRTQRIFRTLLTGTGQ
jgi:hypothetical protein